MGKCNSSETRVKPLGKAIIGNHSLVDKILSIIMHNELESFGEFHDEDVFFAGHTKEKNLPPTKEHLSAIIDSIIADVNFREYIKTKDTSSSINKKRRESLYNLEPKTLEKAKCHFEVWNSFEGPSYPDLFIENDNNIIIIEGKRIEKGTTKSTKFLKHRNQMIRHIENAINYCQGKKRIIAFYIIEKTWRHIRKNVQENTLRNH